MLPLLAAAPRVETATNVPRAAVHARTWTPGRPTRRWQRGGVQVSTSTRRAHATTRGCSLRHAILRRCPGRLLFMARCQLRQREGGVWEERAAGAGMSEASWWHTRHGGKLPGVSVPILSPLLCVMLARARCNLCRKHHISVCTWCMLFQLHWRHFGMLRGRDLQPLRTTTARAHHLRAPPRVREGCLDGLARQESPPSGPPSPHALAPLRAWFRYLMPRAGRSPRSRACMACSGIRHGASR